MIGRHSGASRHATYRMPLYPLAPIVTLIALALIAVATWQDVEEGRPAIVATIIQIVIAAGYYLLVLRRRRWQAVVPTA